MITYSYFQDTPLIQISRSLKKARICISILNAYNFIPRVEKISVSKVDNCNSILVICNACISKIQACINNQQRNNKYKRQHR